MNWRQRTAGQIDSAERLDDGRRLPRKDQDAVLLALSNLAIVQVVAEHGNDLRAWPQTELPRERLALDVVHEIIQVVGQRIVGMG